MDNKFHGQRRHLRPPFCDAQKLVKDVLNVMASQGSQILNTMEMLGIARCRLCAPVPGKLFGHIRSRS